MCIETISVICSSFVSLVAVAATIISTVMTSRHNYKMRVLDFTAKNKLTLYQNFFDVLNLTLKSDSFDDDISFELKRIFAKIYLVCDNQTREQLDKLQKYIADNHHNRNLAHTPEYKLIYDLITVAMREDLKSLRH